MHFLRQIKLFHFKHIVNLNLLISFILLFFIEFINPFSAFSEWNTLENGVDGFAVVALDFDSSGNLYIGGGFTILVDGGGAANNIAKWDGSKWHNLGAGLNGAVHALLSITKETCTQEANLQKRTES